jgi:REP element-mobilizing transposase RayT
MASARTLDSSPAFQRRVGWSRENRVPEGRLNAMSHTYVSDLVHCVFSTKNRRNIIAPQIQNDLWAFLGGIARKNGFKALIIGGTENHVHVLLSLRSDMPLAKAMQLMKGAMDE